MQRGNSRGKLETEQLMNADEKNTVRDEQRRSGEQKSELMNENQILRSENSDLIRENNRLKNQNEEIRDKYAEIEKLNSRLSSENKQCILQHSKLKTILQDSSLGDLQRVKQMLIFNEFETLEKHLICKSISNGRIIYFDNKKPFTLSAFMNGNRKKADLKELNEEHKCLFSGTIENIVYLTTITNKTATVFRATFEETSVTCEQINKMHTSEVSFSKYQPMYSVDRKGKRIIYMIQDKLNKAQGIMYDISEIKFISQHVEFVHRY
ncbi:hypothetical protein PMAYCL1PPCAC_08912 [Pristionchus mayeri]|uniref:Uncharacterized protein n=1 Tax=Pristionchus mayeri TaxID=1317129 RepID=A0AAN5CCU5_9BILA|nr:hypothetical protein PMAYCL1PPCAC_08912 [Pristionchus mayeri]